MATELAESFAPVVLDSGRTLLWSIEPGLTIEGDRELLAQAGINLLENAQRHTPRWNDHPAHACVCGARALASRSSTTARASPRPTGSKIVKRFARLDRSRNTSGYGLGLNLVAAVAKLHGGRLLLKDANPGLSATIELPRAERSRLPANPRVKRRMTTSMTDREVAREALTKVPAVTLGFWIIKILATTLGETGGDSVT